MSLQDINGGKVTPDWRRMSLQDINGGVRESFDIGSNYEYVNWKARICVLSSVAKKKVIATSVSSIEALPTVVLALRVEVPMVASSIRGSKVGEECWNSGLDAWLEAVAASIHLEVEVVATSTSAWLWETLYTTSRELD
jgi:hypothetical protein